MEVCILRVLPLDVETQLPRIFTETRIPYQLDSSPNPSPRVEGATYVLPVSSLWQLQIRLLRQLRYYSRYSKYCNVAMKLGHDMVIWSNLGCPS